MADIEIKMPDIGLEKVEVIEILVKVNDMVQLEQSLIIVEGEKASIEVPSPVSGKIKKIYVNIGDKVYTSSVIMCCESKEIPLEKQNDSNNISYLTKHITKENKKKCLVHATPMVRRFARFLNVNLSSVIGTGPKNRILKEDVMLYQKFTKKENKLYLNHTEELQHESIKLSHLQEVTGKKLHQNWQNIPHVTQYAEADITRLEIFRKKYNNEHQNEINHHNITLLVFIIKIVACALEKFPIFNSSFIKEKNTILLKKYINIGFAVDVPDGLIVPVLKNVNKKNIKKLFSELLLMSDKARKKKLTTSELTQGCFTVSNLGGIGGSWFSPIINAPEVAILGVSKAQIKPLWNGKKFVPSLMLPLSLSYDHRIINGAEAARFITFISKLLSDIHFLMM